MKLYTLIITILLSGSIAAQVAVDKASVDGDGLLDFRPENNDLVAVPNQGLILPNVNALHTNSVPGTIYLNAATGQVEYIDNAGTVMSMSKTANSNPPVLDPTLSDVGTGVVISDGSADNIPAGDLGAPGAPGTLVLDSTNKALILPKVTNPKSTIDNPSAGMMVFDLSSNSIAIYNGDKWSFWN